MTDVQQYSDDPMTGDEPEVMEKEHKFVVSNLDRCSGSAMYTFGDNIVQCSIFGPLQTKEDSTSIKKILSVFLNPLGKIKNTMKGLFLSSFLFEF